MRLALTILTMVAARPPGPAKADADGVGPKADWKPREAVAKMAADLGWTVRRIKIDDGCYEIIGTDAEGRQIEATVDPSTLEILEIEARDNDGRHGRGQEDRSDD